MHRHVGVPHLFYDLFNDMLNGSMNKRMVEWRRLKDGF